MIHKLVDLKLLSYASDGYHHIQKNILSKTIALLGNIFFAYLFAYGWDLLLKGELDLKKILYLGMGMVLSILLRRYGIIKASTYAASLVADIKVSLRDKLFHKLLEMGKSYQSYIDRSSLLHMASEGIEQLETYYGGYIPQFIFCLIADVILFVALAPFHFRGAIILLLLSPMVPLLLAIMLKKVRTTQKKYWDSYSSVGALFLDSIQGLTTLKVFGADEAKGVEIDKRAEQFRVKTMKLLSMQLNSITIINLITYGTTAAVIILGLKSYLAGDISVFAVVLTLVIAAEFFLPLRSLTSLFHIAMTGVTASEKMLAIFDLHIEEGGEEVSLDGQVLEISHLSFQYEKGEDCLQDIDFKVAQGNLIALVGASGCGKSTLATLLNGERRDYQGEIFVDGYNLRDLRSTCISKHITLIRHNSFIFEGSVRENLLMGNLNADDEELIQILQKVDLWKGFKEKDGLDTHILSGGSNLSGGQAQRLGLARGLLHNSPIYVFDEATSNVDIESEDIIMDNIFLLAKKKIVIVISHRLECITKANEILVLADGRIQEKGSHRQLLEKQGLYATLYQEQQKLESYAKEGGDYES